MKINVPPPENGNLGKPTPNDQRHLPYKTFASSRFRLCVVLNLMEVTRTKCEKLPSQFVKLISRYIFHQLLIIRREVVLEALLDAKREFRLPHGIICAGSFSRACLEYVEHASV